MEALQLNRPARILSVGDNSVVEIFLDTAAKIVLTGLKPGETSLLAIDFHGDVIVELDVVVVPQKMNVEYAMVLAQMKVLIVMVTA